MRFLRTLAEMLFFLLLLLVVVVGGAVVALNTQAGRDFAVAKINEFAGPQIRISGLTGHFPADIKLASLSVADKNGVWLTGSGLELRWIPQKLLHRDIAVTALTAASLDVLRRPLAQESS